MDINVEYGEIIFTKPDFMSILYENALFVRFLARYGRDAAFKFVELLLKEFDEIYGTNSSDYATEICETLIVPREKYLSLIEFKSRLTTVKYETLYEEVRMKLPLVKLGKATVVFSHYTYRVPGGHTKDPVNLIFWNQGRYGNVRDIMNNYLSPKWRLTKTFFLSCAETHYLYVNGEWVKMNASLSPQGCRLGQRLHIRLFTGGYDNNLGYVTISSAHEEDFRLQNIFTSGTPHRIIGWDSAQHFVENQFVVAGRFTGRVVHQQLQPQGEVLQGVQHDGLASFIEVL